MTGKHTSTTETPKPQKVQVTSELKASEVSNGSETFSVAKLQTPFIPTSDTSNTKTTPLSPPPEEEDDLTISVIPGTLCKRKGCGAEFVSDAESRSGDGDHAVCVYHPSTVRLLFY